MEQQSITVGDSVFGWTVMSKHWSYSKALFHRASSKNVVVMHYKNTETVLFLYWVVGMQSKCRNNSFCWEVWESFNSHQCLTLTSMGAWSLLSYLKVWSSQTAKAEFVLGLKMKYWGESVISQYSLSWFSLIDSPKVQINQIVYLSITRITLIRFISMHLWMS